MSARSAWVWGNASWREAVRAREAFVDVDHLLLGLVAAGGPAARLLARHGFTLAGGRQAAVAVHAGALASLGLGAQVPMVAPRPVSDLDHRAAGHAPMAPRAKRLTKGLRRGANERDYLLALLAEPSRLVAEVLSRAGVDLDALGQDLAGSGTGWRTPAPVRVTSSTPPRSGRRLSSLRLEHWVPASPHLVQHVGADLGSTDAWVTSPDHPMRVVDGRGQVRIDIGTAGGSPDLVLTAATPERVRWEMWWGQRYGGSHTVDLRWCEGGTMVGLTREITTFRLLGAVMTPPIRFVTGLGMHTMVQNLSFACADLAEEERW